MRSRRARWIVVLTLVLVCIVAFVVVSTHPASGYGPLPSPSERIGNDAASVFDWAAIAALLLTAFNISDAMSARKSRQRIWDPEYKRKLKD